jgi:succinate-acetate transporter protein
MGACSGQLVRVYCTQRFRYRLPDFFKSNPTDFEGFFYGGFGAIITPSFGVTAAYGTDTPEYNNALGFFVLMWTVLNTFFLIGSLAMYFSLQNPPYLSRTDQKSSNLVYFGIFFFVELAFGLVAASYFAAADGDTAASAGLKKAGGACAFVAGILGYYTVAHLMCQTTFFWHFPMGDTSRFFVRKKVGEAKEQ